MFHLIQHNILKRGEKQKYLALRLRQTVQRRRAAGKTGGGVRRCAVQYEREKKLQHVVQQRPLYTLLQGAGFVWLTQHQPQNCLVCVCVFAQA